MSPFTFSITRAWFRFLLRRCSSRRQNIRSFSLPGSVESKLDRLDRHERWLEQSVAWLEAESA